ncbi:MAG: hypothetical protein DYG98_17205 [Haliscomenobacteraceae bacterium CHB4]|nr:hypothetical protein [Saprospiraceae bacterium]MCE7924790.1 hypothetical protein [Haliscomenobacteraceae bacterium CHB4]
MALLKEGEILLILFKRDKRSATKIAEAMGIDKSYLPKLYKMDKLPHKRLEVAKAVFADAEKLFTALREKVDVVEEPRPKYNTPDAAGLMEITQLKEQFAAMRDEITQLKNELEQQKNLSANLAQTLANITKRG